MSYPCKPEPGAGAELTTTPEAPDAFVVIATRPGEKAAYRRYSLGTSLLGQCEHSVKLKTHFTPTGPLVSFANYCSLTLREMQ